MENIEGVTSAFYKHNLQQTPIKVPWVIYNELELNHSSANITEVSLITLHMEIGSNNKKEMAEN